MDAMDRAWLAEARGGNRSLEVAQRGIPVLDRHQAVRLGVAQRPEQHRIDGAEDGGVGPDAEGEREHDDQGESGTLEQAADAVPEVLQQGIHDVARLGRGGGRLTLPWTRQQPERLR
jgi:hypothetical protein